MTVIASVVVSIVVFFLKVGTWTVFFLVGALTDQKICQNDSGGNITLNLKENRAARSSEYLNLTAKEYKLLVYFMRNPMKILSRNQLLEAIWDLDGNFVDENTLAVNIRRLREKVERDPSKPELIKNVRGLGYIWERNCEKE